MKYEPCFVCGVMVEADHFIFDAYFTQLRRACKSCSDESPVMGGEPRRFLASGATKETAPKQEKPKGLPKYPVVGWLKEPIEKGKVKTLEQAEQMMAEHGYSEASMKRMRDRVRAFYPALPEKTEVAVG